MARRRKIPAPPPAPLAPVVLDHGNFTTQEHSGTFTVTLNKPSNGSVESIHAFEHVDELVEEVKRASLDSDMDSSTSNSPSEDWDLNTGYRGALRLAREGWSEGRDAVSALVSRVDEIVAADIPTPALAWDVVGNEVDMGAFLAGEPEDMLGMIEQDKARFVRVIVNLSASWSVKADTLRARGVIACAVVDALERLGYRCEVIVGTRAMSGGHAHEVRAMLKRAPEPVDLSRLAFWLAHPAAFRRLMFRLTERIEPPTVRQAMRYSYGYPSPMTGEPGDILIGEMLGAGSEWTVEAMAKEVERYLKEVGVSVSGGEVGPR